ncbi:uncharacterized protein N7503_000744 [Penicillium pulvis]|uniref:uncharacterized protein n=1 Tax=Penicillium pulvis TaxID=1562058 RepID=UPI002547A004|nr:uncharacterized protein N7503_000744 [Penicillium pulvis]KAJ5813994.1 hypothetical protein N7503_000744 [Penicillium pulvis]
MAPSEEPNPTEGRVSKRRRVAVACDACRSRKSRCDGVRPRCSLCVDLGFECMYTPPATATNVIVQKEYLHGLEDRVKRLEESFRNVRSDVDGLTVRVDRVPEVRDREVRGEVRSAIQVSDLIGSEDSVDAMGAISFADEEDSGFFGPSSNIAFLRHLSSAVVQKGYSLSPGAADGGFVSVSKPSSTLRQAAQEKVNVFALPPQSETLALINLYFSETGLLYPYIYPPTFLATYHRMARENFSGVRKSWLGLLNMILAMATITAESNGASADTRIAQSDVFYQRGLGLCGGELWRGTTLELVQFHLLAGQYLQGTQKSVQVWNVHGLAVKGALQLGLHSQHASRTFDPLEQEFRKRTWYCCVMLDRTLSMTFGRPAAIPDSYVKLDLPSTHQFESSSALVDAETSSLSVSFFNSTITLYKNLWNVLDSLYGQNIGCEDPLSVSETVSHVFSIEQNLFSWEGSLPASLQLITKAHLDEMSHEKISGTKSFSWKFRVILTLRYLNLRVLLHRPVLVKFITASRAPDRDPEDLKLLQRIGMNSMAICTMSAMEIINIIFQAVSDPMWKQSLLGAYWYSLYYTFNAALVILGAIWVYRDTSLTGSSMLNEARDLKEYPARAIAALSKLDNGNRLIDRCRSFLEHFNNVLANPDTEGPTPSLPSLAISREVLQPTDFDFSPFGMELGEFMMDDDFVAMIDRQGLSGSGYD